ncbi:hypothetical protein [Zobellia uliginosa]|uniref:hypothetical protein n=1 Tax=Zobellia uliginosa TaxID=143224 RepID=UPI001C07D57F|nr:hypothetical protein [Zobellia uliginosa]MBU2947027.1 hypothetical protein [Zobellia uliginosa]
MSSNRSGGGCSLIILILLGIYLAYQHFVITPREDAIELQEQIDFWGESTVKYFGTFDCENLNHTEIQTDIEVFFVLFSGKDDKCEINDYIIKDFEQSSKVSPYYSRDIDKANVIVWLDIVSGNVEGKYSNGASAIRNQVELKLIDKHSKAVFRTEIFDAVGSARDEIKRKGGDKRPEHFGRIPYFDIIEFLHSEINTVGNNGYSK